MVSPPATPRSSAPAQPPLIAGKTNTTCAQVILPYYTSLPEAELEGLEHVADFECPKGEVWDGEMRQSSLASSVHRATIDGVPVVLIAPQNRKHSNLFVGDRIYGGSYNELEAYLYFCRHALLSLAPFSVYCFSVGRGRAMCDVRLACRASLETLRILRSPADVIHLHEWQCCAAAMLFWDVLYHDGLTQPRLVLTIHNMDNSGECRQDEFAVTGVPGAPLSPRYPRAYTACPCLAIPIGDVGAWPAGEMFADIDKALDERTIGHNPERLNLMKGGIVYANAVTTVSPTYAEEARSGGAAGYLRTMINEPDILRKFYGILNGIDIDFWCPSNDPMIPAPYNSAAPAGKALCKRFVQQGLGLKEDAKRPLVVCISRLVPQKGIHLIRGAVHHTVAAGGQCVVLGSGHADGDFRAMAETDFKDSDAAKCVFPARSASCRLYSLGHPHLSPAVNISTHVEACSWIRSLCELRIAAAAALWPQAKRACRMMIMYSEPLAHMLYAAADFVIVPSLFEPCGLTQMIAMRYGALPIVRRTGGLADTVFDISSGDRGANGVVFDGADEGACNAAVDRAFALFRDSPEKFSELSKRNMDSDMSWNKSAEEYHDLYRRVRAI